MSPGGWNRQRKASNTQQDSGIVVGTVEDEMIPDEWTYQGEATIKQHKFCPVESAMEKKEMLPEGVQQYPT